MNEVMEIILSTWDSTNPILRGILILFAGWLLALIIRSVVFALLAIFRFDHFADRVGLGEFLRNGQVIQRPSQLLSIFVYRVILVISFMVASRALNIDAVNAITDNLVLALPAISAAIFIMVIGLVIVSFLGNVLDTILRNTTVTNARSVVTGFRIISYGIIFLLASDQLGFGKSLLSTLLLIVFGATALGLAIAFGLGGGEMARKSMERFLDNLNKTIPKDNHGDGEE